MKSSLKILLALVIFSAFAIEEASAQSTNGKGNPSGRENWFPNRGNVGIGTRSPSADLEVIGDVKVTSKLTANDIETVGFEATTGSFLEDVSVGRNLFVVGKVGVGVPNPTHKFEIDGSLKVSESIYADYLEIREFLVQLGKVSGTLEVGDKLYVTGQTGLGVANPAERLEVEGNAVVTQTLRAADGDFSNNQHVGNNLVVDNFIGVGIETPGERIDVEGNIRATNDLMGTSVKTVNGEFSENISVGQNAVVSGNLGVGVVAPAERLEVEGNANISQTLTSSSVEAQSGQFSQSLASSGTLSVSGNTGLGVESPVEKLEVEGNAVINGDVRSHRVVGGSGEIVQDLKVGGSAEIVGGLTVQGPLTAPNFSMDNFEVQNLTVTNVLDLTGGAQIQGDLNVAGVIRAGIIDAQQFRTEGVEAFSLTKVTMDELAVATTEPVPQNYKLAVGGNIIATGVDVKIPSKWPDYVFEADYHLLSPAELEKFINDHGHLPNMPSAREMEEKEVMSLAEMNLKLLEKVEELSLYIIELEKRVKSIESATSK